MQIDNYIANNEFLLSFFKEIHPNIISITGIVTNFLILHYIRRKNISLANSFLIIRFFTDILDGAVARKYNKTSKLGGYLDTINDLILFTMYTYIISICLIFKNKQYSKIFTLIVLLCMIMYLKNIDGLSDHTPLKNGKNNQILAFYFVFL